MATVRELVARFRVKTDPRGFKQAGAGLQRLVKFAQAAATAFVGLKAVQAIKGIADEARALGDRLDKTSQQIGLTTDALQELEFAGGLAGVSAAEMTVAMRMLARTAVEAADGSAEYADEYKKLGVSVRDSNGQIKSADVLLNEVADGMGLLATDTERIAIAQTLLGRSGGKLIPLLTAGSAAIKEQREEARELGLMNRDQIKAAVELTDNQLRLSRAYTAVKLALAERMMPAMNSIVLSMIKFFKANRDLIAQRLFAFMSKVGRTMAAVGRLIADVVRGTRQWFNELDPVTKQLAKMAAIAMGVAIALALPGGTILFLIALIGLLIEDFQTWREGGDSLFGDMLQGFGIMGDAIAGVADALGEAVDEFWAWVEEHKTGLTLVTSMFAGLATVIGVKLVLANKAALASAGAFRLWAVKYYATIAAQAVVSAAKTSAAWVKSAVLSAKAWLVATAPMVITAALLAVIVGTLIFLGAELVKLALGQENFFSTMSDGIADLITEYDGVAPAIGAMLTTAMAHWLTFFGNTEDEADEWIDNLTTTLQDLWVNVLEFWGGKLREFFSGIADLIGIDIGAAGQVTRPATIQRQASAGAGGSVINRNQSSVNVSVTAGPGMNEERLAELIPLKIREEQDRQYRAAQRNLVVEGAT